VGVHGVPLQWNVPSPAQCVNIVSMINIDAIMARRSREMLSDIKRKNGKTSNRSFDSELVLTCISIR